MGVQDQDQAGATSDDCKAAGDGRHGLELGGWWHVRNLLMSIQPWHGSLALSIFSLVAEHKRITSRKPNMERACQSRHLNPIR
jgi:hypothetical protein